MMPDIEAIMDLLYAYFEENKATVPELADVAKADLTTEMVLTRIESSRTVGSINTEGRPVVVVHEVVDKYYDLRLVYKEQHEHVWAEETGPATAHITGKPARQRAAPKKTSTECIR